LGRKKGEKGGSGGGVGIVRLRGKRNQGRGRRGGPVGDFILFGLVGLGGTFLFLSGSGRREGGTFLFWSDGWTELTSHRLLPRRVLDMCH
jgi:hypothetical protein